MLSSAKQRSLAQATTKCLTLLSTALQAECNASAPCARFSLAAQRKKHKSYRQELSWSRPLAAKGSRSGLFFRQLGCGLCMLLADGREKSGGVAFPPRERAFATLPQRRSSLRPADGKGQTSRSEKGFSKKLVGSESVRLRTLFPAPSSTQKYYSAFSKVEHAEKA